MVKDINLLPKIYGNKIDLIVVNDISRYDIGFESDFNLSIYYRQKRSSQENTKSKKRVISRRDK